MDFERQLDKQPTGTTPAYIGDGYGRQFAAMQEQDRQKMMMMKH